MVLNAFSPIGHSYQCTLFGLGNEVTCVGGNKIKCEGEEYTNVLWPPSFCSRDVYSSLSLVTLSPASEGEAMALAFCFPSCVYTSAYDPLSWGDGGKVIFIGSFQECLEALVISYMVLATSFISQEYHFPHF